MISIGLNLVMTVIGFAVSTLFIVFVCTRLICARIHLDSSRGQFPIVSRSDLSMLERGVHGLEPAMVSKLPTKKFSHEIFSDAEDAQCSVCLSEYNGEDILRILPYCGHSFHLNCIDIWLRQHSTCPVCRISLREFPERKRLMQPLSSSHIRSHYDTEIYNTNEFSYGTNENHGINPIQEHQFQTPGDGTLARESTVVSTNDTPTKDMGNTRASMAISSSDTPTTKDMGNKLVESPSNL